MVCLRPCRKWKKMTMLCSAQRQRRRRSRLGGSWSRARQTRRALMSQRWRCSTYSARRGRGLSTRAALPPSWTASSEKVTRCQWPWSRRKERAPSHGCSPASRKRPRRCSALRQSSSRGWRCGIPKGARRHQRSWRRFLAALSSAFASRRHSATTHARASHGQCRRAASHGHASGRPRRSARRSSRIALVSFAWPARVTHPLRATRRNSGQHGRRWRLRWSTLRSGASSTTARSPRSGTASTSSCAPRIHRLISRPASRSSR